MIRGFIRDLNKKADSYRKEGKIPGVIYGPDVTNLPIYVIENEFSKFYKKYKGGFFDFELNLGDDVKKYKGILREVQKHPLSGKIIHFDIYIPSFEKAIIAKVPLEFVSSAPGIIKGGTLSFNLKEIEVECNPYILPEKIEVNLSNLTEIGSSIYVKDLKVPQGIKIITDPNFPIVTLIEESQ